MACSVCGERGHDKRAHRLDSLDALLDEEGPCEEDCPVQWAVLCRYCQRKLCVQHAGIHGCAESWLAKRLEVPEMFVIQWTPEDEGTE